MKTLQFTLPAVSDKTIIVQEDILPKFYPHLHRHKEAQLIWINKGTGTLLIETTIHPFKADDVFYIAPNQSHIFKSGELDTEQEIHSLSIFFDPEEKLSSLLMIPELQNINQFLRNVKGGFRLTEEDNSNITSVFSQIKESYGTIRFLHFVSMLQTLSTCRIQILSEPFNTSLAESEGLRMGKIYDFVLQNFTNDIPLEQVSEIANLTPQAFCRYFKKHTGVTFITFLTEIRINQARKKLLEGKFESITDLAFSCGFNSITNFNRVFKSTVGVSPKEYISTYQKGLS